MELNIPEESIAHTLDSMKKYELYDHKSLKKVNLEIDKVENKWKKTKDYIGKFTDIRYSTSKMKFVNSKIDIIQKTVSIPPYIYIDCNGNIDFCNGRNRFANLRDAGVKEMPFIIEKRLHKKYKKI